jgi:hypothetical protein
LEQGEESYCHKVDCSDVCLVYAVPDVKVFVVPEGFFQFGGFVSGGGEGLPTWEGDALGPAIPVALTVVG